MSPPRKAGTVVEYGLPLTRSKLLFAENLGCSLEGKGEYRKVLRGCRKFRVGGFVEGYDSNGRKARDSSTFLELALFQFRNTDPEPLSAF